MLYLCRCNSWTVKHHSRVFQIFLEVCRQTGFWLVLMFLLVSQTWSWHPLLLITDVSEEMTWKLFIIFSHSAPALWASGIKDETLHADLLIKFFSFRISIIPPLKSCNNNNSNNRNNDNNNNSVCRSTCLNSCIYVLLRRLRGAARAETSECGTQCFLDSRQVAAGRWRSLCEMVSWWWDACPTHWAEVLVLTPWNSSLAHWCCCGDGWSQSVSYPDPLTAAEEADVALGASTKGIMTLLHFFSYFHLCSEILFLFSLDFEFHAD